MGEEEATMRGKLIEALKRLVYETTHLSPMEDDGSHRCTISADALTKAREAIAEASGDRA